MTAAEQRQRRRHAGECGKAVEEVILRPEHDRRPHDDRTAVRRQHQPFAFGLRLRVVRRRPGIGADRGNMNQRCADGFGGARYGFGAAAMHGVEALAAALEQNPDQIDHGIGIVHRRRHRIRVTQIGLDRVDLADPAHRPQMAAQVRAARRNAYPITAAGERAHHVAAEKARAAEHGDQRFKRILQGHFRRIHQHRRTV